MYHFFSNIKSDLLAQKFLINREIQHGLAIPSEYKFVFKQVLKKGKSLFFLDLGKDTLFGFHFNKSNCINFTFFEV